MSFRPILILAAALATGFGATPALAQDASQQVSTITGKVIDEKTGQPLSEVTVQIVGQEVVGTRLAALTGIDGRYRLVNVRPGTVTITVRRIGFTMKQITGLLLEPGKTIEQDVVLIPGSVELLPVVVSAALEKATIAEALETQRLAPALTSGITREAITRSPDADASQVSRRIAGLNLTDEKTVSARGLGPRYTQAALNDARLPSPDPENKVVPLDLFPSSLLDGITVAKTFTPDQSGDFSGAMVQIKTREFPAERTATYSLGFGLNTALNGRSLPLPRGVGGESFAFAGSGRQLPGAFRGVPLNLANTTWADRNAMINSFRNVWQPGQGGGEPNGSMSVTVGGSDLIGGHRFGYIGSGTYSLSREAHLRATRSLGRVGSTAGEFVPYNLFEGTGAGTSALWGGILNLSTLVGAHTQLKLNNTYTRTADNEARIERGIFEEIALPVQLQLMDYVQRSVLSSQFVAARETDNNKIKFSLTGAGVNRSEPDRSEFVQEVRGNGSGENLLWLNSRAESAVRTFADLNEKSVETGLDFQHRLGGDGSSHSIKFGALGRAVGRTTDSRSYTIFASMMEDQERALSPEVLFGGRFTQPDSQVLTLKPLSVGGSYDANDYLGAGYGMFDGYVAENWRLTTGARFEHSFLRVDAASTLGDNRQITKTFDDVLPSAALTFTPSNRVNVRFSLARTLARPEYREVAPLLFRDVIAAASAIGNPGLVRTLIDNADVRWELYPERGELLSVGVFAKRFQNPIERVAINSSAASELETFINARSGTDLGLELEARRNLRMIAGFLEPFTAFANATLMRSRIDVSGTQTATNPKRAMVGQAPYIINTGLTWTPLANADYIATVLFNRIGDRISAAGEFPNPDVIEDARSTFDVSLRFPLLRGMSGRFDAKNLLDEPVTRRQSAVVREQYWTGRVFQLGLTWH
jgi:hypothetical protein